MNIRIKLKSGKQIQIDIDGIIILKKAGQVSGFKGELQKAFTAVSSGRILML